MWVEDGDGVDGRRRERAMQAGSARGGQGQPHRPSLTPMCLMCHCIIAQEVGMHEQAGRRGFPLLWQRG